MRENIYVHTQYSGKGLQSRSKKDGRRVEIERERIDTGMILFEAKRKWMTEGLNSILDTRMVVGKTVSPDG